MLKIYHYLVKYKSLHILFWLIKSGNLYHDLRVSWPNIPQKIILFSVLNEIGFQILCVYITIYILIPRFFYTKKFISYNLIAITLYVVSAIAVELIPNLYAILTTSDLNPTFNWIIVVGNFLEILTYSIIFSILVLVDYYYTKDKINKQKETDRLYSELNFLKAQLNPHFLLNAINNIYVLVEEDKDKSRDYLMKFSQLLRYQLYECSKESLTLKEELEFIKNYINFEKIRLEDNINLEIKFPTDYNQDIKIAPLLIIPFIENCFKHVSHDSSKENCIYISIEIANSDFILITKNTYENKTTKQEGGVGLKNVERRLELLYPENHSLEINQLENYYITELQIKL